MLIVQRCIYFSFLFFFQVRRGFLFPHGNSRKVGDQDYPFWNPTLISLRSHKIWNQGTLWFCKYNLFVCVKGLIIQCSYRSKLARAKFTSTLLLAAIKNPLKKNPLASLKIITFNDQEMCICDSNYNNGKVSISWNGQRETETGE